MRIDVKKFLFIGLEERRELFFLRAQEVGVIHFIDPLALRSKEIPELLHRFTDAIKVLRGLPTAHQEEIEEFAMAEGIAEKILHYRHTLDQLAEEERVTKLEMARVEIFGDFSKEDIAFIEREGNRKVQFFFAKQGVIEEEKMSDNLIFVGSDHALDYFVAINPEPVSYEKMIEMRIDHPYGELKKRLAEVVKEIHENEQRLKSYAKYNRYLHQALIKHLNVYELETAQSYIQLEMEGMIFAVEGWIPEDKITDVQRLADEMDVHMESVAIEPTDVIPTYLENTGLHRIGEDLVHIYDTPSHTDKDPSLWVLLCFAFFFSFIVGDAGYGLVFLGIALYLRYKYADVKGVGKRVIHLLMILGTACVIWGLLTTSFFGIHIAHDNPIRKVSLMQYLVEKKASYHLEHHDASWEEWVKKAPELAQAETPKDFLYSKPELGIYGKFSDSILMELALFVGTIHIILAFLRYLGRNPIGIGWIIFMIGAYLYIPGYLHATSLINYVFGIDKARGPIEGVYLMEVGFAIAMIISFYKNKWMGVFEPMALIQIFADVMSYLRLYALGLAGAIVAGIINEVASGAGFVLGGLLILFGHTLNIVLAAVGGLIHGLRLNFLEWYHHSFEGGGKMFKPLRKLDVD